MKKPTNSKTLGLKQVAIAFGAGLLVVAAQAAIIIAILMAHTPGG